MVGLVRWSPFQELETMQRQLSRLLEGVGTEEWPGESGQWLPAVDIRETEDALLVEAELPGIDKKDVKVEVKDGTLTISGERKYEKDVKEENVHRIERAYGRFVRALALPSIVDTNKVEAEMKDGVLKLRLPKVEQAKARTIAIR